MIYSIDVFNDYLAFAGESNDNALTRSSKPPIIGVIIISLPGTQFKWAKAYDGTGVWKKSDCLSYSQDGTLIAASIVTNSVVG